MPEPSRADSLLDAAGEAATGENELDWILLNCADRTEADLVILAYRSFGFPSYNVIASAGDGRLLGTALARVADIPLSSSPLFRRWAEPPLVWLDADGGPIGGILHMGLQSMAERQLALIAVYRRESALAADRIMQVAERLHPFFSGYFRLWQLHRGDSKRIAGLESALNLSQLATLILDAAGEVIFANPQALRLLDARDGLRRKGRSIAAIALPDAVALQVAIDHVLAQHSPRPRAEPRKSPLLRLTRPDGRRPLVATILPVDHAPGERTDPAVIVYALVPDGDLRAMLEPVCKLHHLSPVETRLVVELASGLTLDEAAERLHVKPQTARSYLKQIFVKTDTNRQAELVRVMLSSLLHISAEAEPLANSDL
ncbi:helix-turn-helix transcriptional regulator [Sphingomonas oleivorans]|nr:PAS domain-containing protein [Sphingomonas oleivorans]